MVYIKQSTKTFVRDYGILILPEQKSRDEQ